VKKRTCVLVTGAGALLGQGILRCLQEERLKYRIVTADPDFRSSGHWLGDKACYLPPAKSQDYLDELKKIILAEKVEFILVGTDVELPILAANRSALKHSLGVNVVISPSSVIEIANNKWLTAEFLRTSSFPYPVSALATEHEQVKQRFGSGPFPLIAKPVDGARSKGLRRINSISDLAEILNLPGSLVVQEFLPEDEGEFTAGCLVFNGKCYAAVVMRRDLRDGNTYRAYSDITSRFDKFISKVAEKLGVEGPCNFQFRIRNGEPVIFEINARFSGTTPLRLIFGFNEVAAVLDYYISGVVPEQPKILSGVVLRTYSDVFIDRNQFEKFREEQELEKPRFTEFTFSMKKIVNE
jgi:carbamoyl-phosphate synthase large subunit